MKKFFLVLWICFPAQAFSHDSIHNDFFQGLWPNFADKDDSNSESRFSGSMISDINFDRYYRANDRKNEYKDTTGTVRFSPSIKINKNLSLHSNLELSRFSSAYEEEIRAAAPDGGGDRSFDDNAIVVRELAVNYSQGDMSLIAGKFTPNFGTAWRWGRGIWSQEMAENYRQDEKLGLGGIVKAGDKEKTGRYNFGFSAFTNDRKNLDNSLMNKRDSDRKSDARAGDTRSLESFVASVDVAFDFQDGEELRYHFAYLNLAVDEKASHVTPTKIDDQKGFVVNGRYRYPVNDAFLLDGLLEYTDMKNVGGDSDVSDKYFSASLVGEIYHNWNITLASSLRQNIEIDYNGFDQSISEVSVGYEMDKTRFFDQLLIQTGYKNLRTDYKSSIIKQNSYGVLVRYVKLF